MALLAPVLNSNRWSCTGNKTQTRINPSLELRRAIHGSEGLLFLPVHLRYSVLITSARNKRFYRSYVNNAYPPTLVLNHRFVVTRFWLNKPFWRFLLKALRDKPT